MTDSDNLDFIADEAQLETLLTTPPRDGLKEDMEGVPGDFLILGAGGKMGLTLSGMLKNALPGRAVTAVSRFSNPESREKLNSYGIKTVQADLLEADQVAGLPDAENVVFMAGQKFGTSGNQPMTWAQNTYAPALAASRFRASRIMAFSTGNVYPFSDADSEGPAETDPVGPVGEYAQSCVGRERIFQYFSQHNKTPVVLVRLNYACEMRYGVLVDIGRSVLEGNEVDLAMGQVNVIWQGTAVEYALRAFTLADSPAAVLNISGPKHSVREIAEAFGKWFGKAPKFKGEETETALLNNGERARRLFGDSLVSTETLIRWIAGWLEAGKTSWEKLTHFQQKDGNF